MPRQAAQDISIRRAIKRNGDAAGAAVVVRQLDAVDVCLADGRVQADGVRDFVCGHVFRLPAERVADAVAEEDAPVAVPVCYVAAAEPGVALGEDVAQDLGRCCFRVVVVALEARLEVLRGQFEEHFARFAARHAFAEARFWVAPGLVFVPVYLDHGDALADEGAVEPAVAADGAGAVVVFAHVPGPEGSFGGGVELGYGFDAEARFELVPDVGAEAVAECCLDVVCLV